MPEEIYVDERDNSIDEYDHHYGCHYIRADKYEALQKQNDIMREALERIANNLVALYDDDIKAIAKQALEEVK